MSQDDGGDLLTWKISPVNQRLQSLSKHIDSIRPCSLNQATPPTVTLLNKLLCPPPREPPQTNLLPVNSVGFKGANPLQDTQQSPFRTIPSLSYANDKIFLGPLMFTSKCVLVGDHYQLPPLVQSTEAQENGMGISLFCRLSEAHPQAIAALQSQYQMCQGIMELSNALIDGDKLRCGSSEIANAKLHLSSLNSCSSWLKKMPFLLLR